MSRKFVIEKEGFPDLAGMMLVTVEALKQMGGSARIDELSRKVVEIENVSEQEQSYEMSGKDPRSRLNYYLAWARTYLKNGGALENSSRGVWALTDLGEQIETKEQTEQIRETVAEASRQKKKETEPGHTATDISAPTGLETDLFDEVDDWQRRLLTTLAEVEPEAFERLTRRVLLEAGFQKVEVRGQSGDGGIDGVGILRVNLVSFQVFFQCKRWKGTVGAREIRDFRGAMQGRADKGLFVTTGRFTTNAENEATRDGATAIDLIDGERLCDLLKEYSLGVETKMIEAVTISEDWFKSV